jgi:hypothetical protein
MLTGRKSVRENELYQQGGLLSFPRTGCALRARKFYHHGNMEAVRGFRPQPDLLYWVLDPEAFLHENAVAKAGSHLGLRCRFGKALLDQRCWFCIAPHLSPTSAHFLRIQTPQVSAPASLFAIGRPVTLRAILIWP